MIYTEQSHIFFTFFFTLFGALLGSFSNVVILRMAGEKSVIFPPSACPTCNHQLHAIDLIPVFSWLFLRGRCRYCKSAISPQYPIVEAIIASIVGISFFRMGITPQFVVMASRLIIWFIASVLFLRNEVTKPDPYLWAVIFFLYLNFPIGGCPFIDRSMLAIPFIAAATGLLASIRHKNELVYSWGCLTFIFIFSSFRAFTLWVSVPVIACVLLALNIRTLKMAKILFFLLQISAIGIHLFNN